ncbi:helix-turn-helix domain-containing protein [Nanchangia anserum]|uniref:Helix-turn-helix domain-containing protein n=1 Tax=Nanchangia anserum TaxID=2692125 RepID=A0A8I0GBY0_9ACTO|nr:helix-turn-helix domain-containing protein [Nanchangia anserum]MBD3689350.1 helix-turn-helix domain-containing protein [Nanchangia anserum]QOX81556.1 helix-turn-helix domain-containing protein [Nanchangia anserum]
MPQPSGPRFVTVAEVAELMRVSKMTVYRMIHSGEIPAVRVGKSFRVPQSAVQQLIDAGLGDWSATQAGGEVANQ